MPKQKVKRQLKRINNYEYSYSSCIGNSCDDKTGVIVPNDNINNSLIILDYSLNIDKDSQLYTFVKNDLDFFNKFGSISYNINNQTKTRSFVGINNANVKDKILMEVPKEIINAKDISVNISTRSNKYIFKLK